ncbi:MAG: TonB-dependent receptor [Bryobacterales bacterium]|nr:TonB-dependent receptor [Bryobacterales bacterium]
MRKLFAAVAALSLAGAACAETKLSGQVWTPTRAPVAGARITAVNGGGERVFGFSDPQGRFSLALPAPGEYRVTAEHEGFFPAQLKPLQVGPEGEELALTLEPLREVVERVEVHAQTQTVDMDTTNSTRTMRGEEILNIPYPNTNDFKAAARMMPGVVRDSRGGIHVNGSAEDQVLYTLDGFNLNDPLTGRLETRLSVESVQTVEIASGHLPAEYGKGSGGTLAVHTQAGDNQLRYSATNFVPGLENRKGWTIGDWSPRVGVSGPILKDRAWFSNTVDFQYSQVFIRDLPKGQDRYSQVRLGNLLYAQVNVTPSQILYAGFLVNAFNAARTGLTALDPVETTIDRRSRQWFWHVKDQIYLTRGWLVEAGFASNRTFGREIPQGQGMLIYTANGKRGNYFMDGVRKGGRDQILVNSFPPRFKAFGEHQLKTGMDLDHVTYWQDVRRTGFENYSEAGKRTFRTVYGGSGLLGRDNDEAAAYVQDSWRIAPGVLIEAGARTDWGRILHTWSLSPRIGAAWSPGRKGNMKIYAGYARVYDATNLRLFTRPFDQYALATYFGPNGDVVRGPALTTFEIRNPHLARPRFQNWSLGLERHLPGGFSFRADMLRRRGWDGFTYLNANDRPDAPPPAWAAVNARVVDSLFDLSNYRTDAFDSFSITARQNIRNQYEWMLSYTRSRALSNTVVDISVEDPIMVVNNVGPMPWDSPHRLLGWGYLPLLKDWALAFSVDARTGFPFSARTDDGRIFGDVNSIRFPFYFELNVHLERRFVFRGNRWALRFGANDITNRVNPDTVNNVMSSSGYMRFYGGTGRALNVRVRWLGRVQK